MHQMQETPDDREFLTPKHGTKVSPIAIGLTFAMVIFAVVIGLTGPRLRERQGTTQQDLPIGDLATIAAMHELRAITDIAEGRDREAALAKLPELMREALGARGTRVPASSITSTTTVAGSTEPTPAPDLSPAGWFADDARNVELAPGVLGTMVLYRNHETNAILSVIMLPDDGRTVRFDGFGQAIPIAPGDEWLQVLAADESGNARTAYALSDGRILWLALGNGKPAVARIAKLLK